MKNPYAKLDLTADDLPDDPATLVAGIRRIASTLIASTTNFHIPDVKLSTAEINALYRFAHDEVIAPKSYNAHTIAFSRARTKLAKSISVNLHKLYERDKSGDTIVAAKQQVLLLLHGGRHTTAICDEFAKILDQDLFQFDANKLPTETQSLKEIAFNLLRMLRGQLNTITKFLDEKGIKLNDAQPLILSTVYSSLSNLTSQEFLSIALNPFADPTRSSTLPVNVMRINQALENIGVTIFNRPKQGFYLTPESHAVIDAYRDTPNKAARQLPSPLGPAPTAG